ncbi:unnamed protein product, partial [Symbiodinium sp. CCMP2456]
VELPIVGDSGGEVSLEPLFSSSQVAALLGLAAGIESIEVFTDGSFDGRISSWAFAAIAQSSAGRFVFAWARGSVQLQGFPWHVGATEHSALNGERSALFWAVGWLFGVDRSISRSLHSDCLVAARQTSGDWGSQDHAAFAVACRSLAQALEAAGGLVVDAICHVKGHQGHPYNELVDVLAGAQHLDDTTIARHLSPLCEWAEQGNLPWLWLSISALCAPNRMRLQPYPTAFLLFENSLTVLDDRTPVKFEAPCDFFSLLAMPLLHNIRQRHHASAVLSGKLSMLHRDSSFGSLTTLIFG